MLRRERRVSAHGLARDPHGRVLMVAGADGWRLPGAVLEHGEAPEAAAARVAGVTGVGPLVAVVTDVDQADGAVWHWDRLIFEAAFANGGTWVEPRAAELAPFTARALGLTTDPVGSVPALAPVPAPLPPSLEATPSGSRRQRFAAYGLATDPAGRVLLSLISEGFPGAGSWHLPGGGTDFGEEAVTGLLRELIEETNQEGQVVGLLGASHRHRLGEVGPEGVPLDWHGVRVVFRVEVTAPTPPVVTEQGGSTAAAAWFDRDEALGEALTEIAREMILLMDVA